MLDERSWKLKYTPEDGDLVKLFYVPALRDAVRYDRLTGYFNAAALKLATRGIEALVRNDGRMRLVVGCTLEPPEIEAIERGAALRDQVAASLARRPLAPPDASAVDALALLAWMVEHGHLDVKVAVPCDLSGKPVCDSAIFHEKAGIVEDRGGHRIAWNGSLNETAAGWQGNWESINVFTDWGRERERVDAEERNFARLWAGEAKRALVLDVPDAARRDLLRFLPEDAPSRLRADKARIAAPTRKTPAGPSPAPLADQRSQVWHFIRKAPTLGEGGAQVGAATAAVAPWPHQSRTFGRLYAHWPPKLLIADEVGLGKTIQAGLLLRQAWLAGRAKRILILAPKAVLGQWQIELREKFNLNWPVYDGRKLVRRPSPGLPPAMLEVERERWHDEPAVIVSSHLMRRRDRARTLLEDAEPWDLVVLDEAHHARRRGGLREGDRPNTLLALMRELRKRTDGLLLLTATPMQVHPVEVWDLLNLLGLPPAWTEQAFLTFFDDLAQTNPSAAAMERMAGLFRAVERDHGDIADALAEKLAKLSRLKTRKVLRALRDPASIPRRQLETDERRAARAVMRAYTPLKHLVSRHTRELLRRYFHDGRLTTPIAARRVEDRFLRMTAAERDLYDAVDAYIRETYARASDPERSAVGFVMTVYRRRLASSFAALRATFSNRLRTLADGRWTAFPEPADGEDAPDDETAEIPDDDELGAMRRRALAFEEEAEIRRLLARVRALAPDSKLAGLTAALDELARQGYRQTMVFTQYVDTMDFLRERLRRRGGRRLLCFSGRGGEIPAGGNGGGWRGIDRDEAKRRFRAGEADILLCTDAAAEGLNFQFCGALVNYDMPWNPMRVEQRIGRIDRLGQAHPTIRIVNLHYEDTVETDVYRALRERIGLFEKVVGHLQPILARLPRLIAETALAGDAGDAAGRGDAVEVIDHETREAESHAFDIDAVSEDDFAVPEHPPAALAMDDLDRLIRVPDLMPPGVTVKPLGRREYEFHAPGMPAAVRVTTDSDYYDEHSQSVELWSPGNPLFTAPDNLPAPHDSAFRPGWLRDLLDSMPRRSEPR